MNPAPFQNADDRPDHELVRLTLDGELDAFDELVRRHQGMITRSLYQFFRNHEDLEDLVQEVFIRGFRKLGTWKAPAPFHLWLRRIGYNLAYDKLRARRRNPLVNACEADPRESRDGEGRSTRGLQLRDQGTLPDVQADRSDLIDWLMSKLDADDAMILTLQYLEQVPLSEIARSVGWSVAKVKIKSFRARNRLKSLIENHENIAT